MRIRLYLDSNALIRAVEGDDATSHKLRRIISGDLHDRVTLVTSALGLTEVLAGVFKQVQRPLMAETAWIFMESYISFFEELSPFEIVHLDQPVLIEAARLRSQPPKLTTPDALHLASALKARCSAFLSDDRALMKRAEGRGLSSHSLDPADLDALLTRIVAS